MPTKNEEQRTTNAIENLDCLSNEFSLEKDWLRIPYGEHPLARRIQRLTRQSAETMVANFKSFSGRLGRFFGGNPIYIGHPDDPTLANQFPDKKAYGWIMDMEAREDGLYLKPKWSAAGEELLANAHYKWFSPYWGCRPIPASGSGLVEPVRLVSLGLTNSPNIQGLLPLANEDISDQPDPSDPSNPSAINNATKGVSKPMKEALIKLLNLANEATDEQILSAIAQKATADQAAVTALANAKAATTALETTLANEKTARAAKETELTLQISNQQSEISAQKKARIELVLANALAAGKITPAQKSQWAADLEKDLDGKLVELSNAKPVMNTDSKTKNLGARNSNTVANRDASTRRDKVFMLVNERITKTGEDYESAFANIRKENSALFDEMQQPGKK